MISDEYERESELIKRQLNDFNHAIAKATKNHDEKEKSRLITSREIFIHNMLKKRRPKWIITDKYQLITNRSQAKANLVYKPKKPPTNGREFYKVIKKLDNQLKDAQLKNDYDLTDRVAKEKEYWERKAIEFDPEWGTKTSQRRSMKKPYSKFAHLKSIKRRPGETQEEFEAECMKEGLPRFLWS